MNESSLAEEAVRRVLDRTVRRTVGDGQPGIVEVLGETLYLERLRLADATGANAAADRSFFDHVALELGRVGPADPRPGAPHKARGEALLREVIEHYAREIRGRFDARTYAVATRVLPVAIGSLLGGPSPAHLVRSVRELPNVERNIVLEGAVDTLKALTRRGTVVLLPTHSSNFDSLILGLSIFQMGLPPFSYGAGLNLFHNPITSFFMNRLGAYKVDRTKTDPLYREILKEFATVLLESGRHMLFFPGGTRSRSGALESHLKKGLLGTGLTAFKNNLRAGKSKPRIFIVPATVSYPLVLEAHSMIVDYLEQSGRGRYLRPQDEFTRLVRWVEFLGGLLRLNLRVHVVIGKPLDPFGNDVDAAGQSHDGRGRPLDPSRYLWVDGAIADDAARDAEYTREVALRVLEAYRLDNVALPTGIVAFAVFELLRKRSPDLDLYRLLRGLDSVSLPERLVVEEAAAVHRELRTHAAEGRIRLGSEASEACGLVDRALRTFGTYHSPPVLERRGNAVAVGNPNLLFFYRNRLEGYGLRNAAPLLPRASP